MNQEYLQQAERLEQLRSVQASSLSLSPGASNQVAFRDALSCGGLAPEGRPLTDPLIYPGVYAPSGFNIMDILVKIRTRPNATINIGKIDHGVALTLCDFDAPDLPIVYCSEPFESLTGYQSSEILGRNCRFLQRPYDEMEKISPEDSKTNEAARKELREKIDRGEEASVQLINFTRDGRKFLNILTTIPITWEGGKRYIVGFQADAKRALV